MSRSVNDHIKELIRLEIKNALTENKLKIGQGSYSVRAFSDSKGTVLSFVPDSKTLDIPVNTQVDEITKLLKMKLGKLASVFYFESGHSSAGRVFRLHSDSLTDLITSLLA